MIQRTVFVLLLLLVCCLPALADDRILVAPGESPLQFPALDEYRNDIRAALRAEPPVLKKRGLLASDARQAESLALADERVLRTTRDPRTGQPMRSEVFQVFEAGAADTQRLGDACREVKCFRVEVFNFVTNALTRALVRPEKGDVIEVTLLPNVQPELPPHLQSLAVEIARRSPAIRRVFDAELPPDAFVMSSTKTALNRTQCERSQHLCVAPTYVRGRQALWAIVDLTDLRLVGAEWTSWNDESKEVVSEISLRNRVVQGEICRQSKRHEQADWQLHYMLTGSDGLLVSDVSFKGQPMLRSAKNLDWHVSYSATGGFGYSDAVGCPLFSTAAIVPPRLPAFSAVPATERVPAGFELRQDFVSPSWPLPCSYYYQNRFQFFGDGSYRIVVANVGRGCGNTGTYRPVIRFELPIDVATFSEWDGTAWRDWEVEAWSKSSAKDERTPAGYRYRVTSADGGGFYIEPSHGQFGDGGRGDDAFLYVTKYHAERDEGASDTPTLGPCCNVGFEQGPERFIEAPPERIVGARLVLWYVAEMKNDESPGHEYCWARSTLVEGELRWQEFPCLAGPRIVPFKGAVP